MSKTESLSTEVGSKRVLIVNSSMDVKEVVSWKKAVTLLFEDKAYTLVPRPNGELVRSPSVAIEMPLVVVLKRYSKRYARTYELDDEVTKAYVRSRDRYVCQYCGNFGNTIDHVMPQSRGGKNTWGNLVTACKSCNGFKADRTPEEAGMKKPLVKSGVMVPGGYEKLQTALYEALEELV